MVLVQQGIHLVPQSKRNWQEATGKVRSPLINDHGCSYYENEDIDDESYDFDYGHESHHKDYKYMIIK